MRIPFIGVVLRKSISKCRKKQRSMKTYDRAGGPGLKGGTAEGIDKVLRLPLICEDTPDMVELEKFEDLLDMVVLEMSGGTIPGPGVFILL